MRQLEIGGNFAPFSRSYVMHTIENQDRTLSRFIETIQEQEARKQDYLANTAQLQFRTITENDAEPTSQLIMEASNGSLTRSLMKYSSVNQPSE